MIRFKNLAVLAVVSFLLFSCSNDDQSAEAYQPKTSLIVKTTDSDGLVIDYTYDTNNRLVNLKRNSNASNPAQDRNFTYNTDGTLNEIREASGGGLVMKYFYSGNKVVRKEGRNGLDVYLYSYSGNTVIENYRFTTTNSGFRNVYTFDNQGNISQVEYYTNASNADPLGTYSATETRNHDNKRNAYESLPAAYLFPYSANNEVSFQANGGPLNTSVLEYNADNYPSKKISGFTRLYQYRQL